MTILPGFSISNEQVPDAMDCWNVNGLLPVYPSNLNLSQYANLQVWLLYIESIDQSESRLAPPDQLGV